MSELAEPFDMALPSFTQHLQVLEKCGLVVSARQKRRRYYHVAPGRLELAENWLAEQRSQWERRLDQLDDFLLALDGKGRVT